MTILVRNEEHVSECTLVNGGYIPREEILAHPQVRQLVGNREIRSAAITRSTLDEKMIFVDLNLSKPR